MKVNIEIDEKELTRLVISRLQELMPDASITATDVLIEVKSKQNYRSEWESAAFRATIRREF